MYHPPQKQNFHFFILLLTLPSRGSRPGPVVILEVVVVKISAGIAQGSELFKGGFALAGFGQFVFDKKLTFDFPAGCE